MMSTNSARAEKEKPDIDETLAEIMIGYHFLSDQRGLSIGMAGGVPLAIPISEMLVYYDVFQPRASKTHFVKVVRAADNMFLTKSSEAQKNNNNNKRANKSSSGSDGSVFPTLPK